MHVLTIMSFDVVNRRKVVERCALEQERSLLAAQNYVELVDLSANRIVRLCHVTNPGDILGAHMLWGDLARIESVRVMENKVSLGLEAAEDEIEMPSGMPRESYS